MEPAPIIEARQRLEFWRTELHTAREHLTERLHEQGRLVDWIDSHDPDDVPETTRQHANWLDTTVRELFDRFRVAAIMIPDAEQALVSLEIRVRSDKPYDDF